MIKSIIVEDDPSHSDNLQNLLLKLGLPVEVSAVTTSVEGAVDAIKANSPDLVFLDIILEGGQTGFDLLSFVKKTDFDIIFTTAYIDKNIREIRLCAVDYIVKPYVLTEVKEVLEKYLSDHLGGLRKQRLNSLRTNISARTIDHNTIWVPDNSTYNQVQVSQILYCEADNVYARFHILGTEGKPETLFSSKGLGKWEEELTGYNFCRISRKHLVNIKHVLQFQKNMDQVILTTGALLHASQTGKEALLKVMKR